MSVACEGKEAGLPGLDHQAAAWMKLVESRVRQSLGAWLLPGLAREKRFEQQGTTKIGGIARKITGQPVFFGPTTAQRYISSVSTIVISGLGPIAAASTVAAEVNWWGVKPGLKTMRF